MGFYYYYFKFFWGTLYLKCVIQYGLLKMGPIESGVPHLFKLRPIFGGDNANGTKQCTSQLRVIKSKSDPQILWPSFLI